MKPLKSNKPQVAYAPTQEVVEALKENDAAIRHYNNFDEFFADMSKTYALSPKHKDSLKAHLSSLKILSVKDKWKDGLKHYLGIV